MWRTSQQFSTKPMQLGAIELLSGNVSHRQAVLNGFECLWISISLFLHIGQQSEEIG